MLFLERFCFPSVSAEEGYMESIRRTSYITYYPFRIFNGRGLEKIRFDQITIFYGNNGSGKSTALNVIAEKIEAERFSSFNTTNFFEPYVSLCDYEMPHEPSEKLMVTSDAVFEYMFNTRAINEGVDIKREELADEYQRLKYEKASDYTSIGDYENLRKILEVRRNSESGYFRKNSMMNVTEQSNGESALRYFENKINENGIYLLDEPENSLSPEKQLSLKKFIEDSARFYNCQFIIATHSPFLLSLDHARIYNLDKNPVQTDRWTELENIATYYSFFKEHSKDFEEKDVFMPEFAASYRYSKQDRMIEQRLIELGIDDEPFFEYIAKRLHNGEEKTFIRRFLNDSETKSITKHRIMDQIEYIVSKRDL